MDSGLEEYAMDKTELRCMISDIPKQLRLGHGKFGVDVGVGSE
jgi:hypothetical protein